MNEPYGEYNLTLVNPIVKDPSSINNADYKSITQYTPHVKIGIDPDIGLSGYAIMAGGVFEDIRTLKFFEVCDEIKVTEQICRSIGNSLVVYIEAGWLHKKSNWHGGRGAVAQKIAKNVGTNHAVGKLFVAFCEHYGIKHEEVLPKGKVDAKTFWSITGWKPRTNQEQRDAAMLIF